MPFESARIELCKESLTEGHKSKGRAYIEMATSLLTGLSTNIVYRIDVNFCIAEKFNQLDLFYFIEIWIRGLEELLIYYF